MMYTTLALLESTTRKNGPKRGEIFPVKLTGSTVHAESAEANTLVATEL